MANNSSAKPAPWQPNEAPTGRWVGFFFASFGVMVFFGSIFGVVQELWHADGVWAWVPETVCGLMGFVFAFLFMAILSRAICKTTLRQLILGSAGKFNWGQAGKMIGAWAIGMLISIAYSSCIASSNGTTELNSIGALPILVNFLICLAFVWMQTTVEEILMRCTFLRAVCGDKIGFSVKCVIWGIISSFVFMLMHGMNPEVLTQGNTLLVVTALATYLIAGLGMYFADVVYGNCLPGCAIHWINNFFIFIFITEANTAVQTGSLFVTTGSSDGVSSLISTILMYLPILVVLIIDARKGKQQA